VPAVALGLVGGRVEPARVVVAVAPLHHAGVGRSVHVGILAHWWRIGTV